MFFLLISTWTNTWKNIYWWYMCIKYEIRMYNTYVQCNVHKYGNIFLWITTYIYQFIFTLHIKNKIKEKKNLIKYIQRNKKIPKIYVLLIFKNFHKISLFDFSFKATKWFSWIRIRMYCWLYGAEILMKRKFQQYCESLKKDILFATTE